MYLNPPHRAQHIGSLLRPPALSVGRAIYERGECSLQDLRSLEDDAVAHVVELQRAVGMRTLTDGEVRRYDLQAFCCQHPPITRRILTVECFLKTYLID